MVSGAFATQARMASAPAPSKSTFEISGSPRPALGAEASMPTTPAPAILTSTSTAAASPRSGELAYGIRARHQPVTKDEDDNFILRTGNITIDPKNLTITTNGVAADGIQGYHQNIGDLIIRPKDATIRTLSRGIYRNTGTLANGIYGIHTGVGDVTIDARAGPSRRRARIPTASRDATPATATSASPRTPTTPSPPRAITPTASWPTISVPRRPGPWR